MPKLKTVSAQAQVGGANPFQQRLRASDVGGGQGLIAAGKAVGQFGDFLQQRDENAEMSEVRKALSSGRAQHTQYMIDSAQTMEAGGAGFTDNMKTTMGDWVSATRGNFKTKRAQQAFDEGSVSMQNDLTTRAYGIQARSFATKTKVDFLTGWNDDRNTMVTDPSQSESILLNRHAAIDELPLSGDQRAALHEQIDTEGAISGVQGVMEKDPALVLQQLEDGVYDDTVDADNVRALKAQAKQGIRAEQADIELAKTRAKEARAAEVMTIKDDYLTRMQPGADNPVTNSEIIKSTLDPKDKVAQMDLLAKMAGPDRGTDPTIFNETIARVYLPEGDPRRISNEDDLEELVNNGLSFTDFKSIRTELRDARTPEVMMETSLKKGLIATAKTSITGTDPLLRMKDPRGDANLQRYMSWMLPEYARLKAEGMSTSELTSADGPLGVEAIAKFTRPRAEQLRDMFQAGSDIPEPPKVAPPAEGGVGAPPSAPTIDISRAVQTTVDKNGVKYYDIDGVFVNAQGEEFGK